MSLSHNEEDYGLKGMEVPKTLHSKMSALNFFIYRANKNKYELKE